MFTGDSSRCAVCAGVRVRQPRTPRCAHAHGARGRRDGKVRRVWKVWEDWRVWKVWEDWRDWKDWKDWKMASAPRVSKSEATRRGESVEADARRRRSGWCGHVDGSEGQTTVPGLMMPSFGTMITPLRM
jgi:hypothetical protein